MAVSALPARVPTHWNAQGQIDGWSPRFWAVAMWPLVPAGLAWVIVGLKVTPQHSVWWLLAIVLAAGAIPYVYSYLAYRRMEGRSKSEGDRT